MTQLEQQITLVAVLIPSVILHEVAHGVVAYAFGDDTAKRAGRLTLNPIPHIDPFGSIILPALLAFTSLGVIGYAKPVPVNPRRLRSPRNHSLLVSLAGPATNISLALASVPLYHAARPGSWSEDIFLFFGFVNVLLATFNLLPLPPLDGSALIERMLPARLWPHWLRFRQYSMGILLLVVLVLPSGLSFVFNPVLDVWLKVL